MKKAIVISIMLLSAIASFASDDRVLVILPEISYVANSDGLVITYSGNMENFSGKPALVCITADLMDKDNNVLDSRVLVSVLEPRARAKFTVNFTFPIDEFIAPECIGVLCYVQFYYGQENRI